MTDREQKPQSPAEKIMSMICFDEPRGTDRKLFAPRPVTVKTVAASVGWFVAFVAVVSVWSGLAWLVVECWRGLHEGGGFGGVWPFLHDPRRSRLAWDILVAGWAGLVGLAAVVVALFASVCLQAAAVYAVWFALSRFARGLRSLWVRLRR